MRGQLTEQLPEDGSAEELYQQIQKGKADILRNRNGRNDKNIKDVDEGVPYEIPSQWKWIRFGEIGLFKKGPFGSALTKSMFVPKGTDTIKVYEQQHAIRKDSTLGTYYITKQYFDEKMNGFEVKPGDILISCAGTIGETYIMPDGIEQGIINQALMRVTLAPGINKSFFQYYFDTNLKGSARSGNGSAIINIPPFDIIKNWYFPLAPFAEQQRIVDKINQALSVLDAIDTLQAQYADNLTALKAKLIDAAIQGKLTEHLPEDGSVEELYSRVQEEKTDILKERKGRVDKNIKEVDNDVPYDIPAHWKWIRFGELGMFKKGPFGSALTKAMFVPKSSETVKVYEQQNAIQKDSTLGTYYITKEYFDEKMNGFEVRSGDILISCAGTIGETYIMPDDIEKGIINQALMRVTLVQGINKKFFQYYFDSNLKSSARAGNGSAIVNIPPFDVIKNWYFPLAPIEEQERIVTKLEEVFAEMKI